MSTRRTSLTCGMWKFRVKCTKTCFINALKRSTIGKTFAWQKNFNCHQLPDSPCQRQIWPVKSGAKLKPGCYSDMTLNFFSPSKHFANNESRSGIDKITFWYFSPYLFRSKFLNTTLIIWNKYLLKSRYLNTLQWKARYWLVHRWISEWFFPILTINHSDYLFKTLR